MSICVLGFRRYSSRHVTINITIIIIIVMTRLMVVIIIIIIFFSTNTNKYPVDNNIIVYYINMAIKND